MPEIVQSAGLLVYRVSHSTSCPSGEAPLYLMLHSSSNQNRWSPPKGHLEAGESLLDCAIRETSEESGITQLRIVDDFLPEEIRYPSRQVGDRVKSVTFWLAEVTDASTTVVLSHEHRDFRWCQYAEAVELAQSGLPQILPLLDRARRFIASNSDAR